MVLEHKTIKETIGLVVNFLNENPLIKYTLTIALVALACNSVYQMGANIGRFAYLLIH